MIEYNVPFASQKSYLQEERHPIGCGIASLKMLLDYWHAKSELNLTDDIDSLYTKGEEAGAYNQQVGWMHSGLVGLAKSYGYDSYNLDFGPKSQTPKTAEGAWAELLKELNKGPVMASVYSDFDPKQGGGHLVIVTGVTENTVKINDPKPRAASEGMRTMPLDSFLNAFKHRYIVVRPKD